MIAAASSLEEAVRGLYGGDCRIESRRSVGGGDINAAAVLELTGGHRIFLKENRSDLAPMFAAEAVGLEALAKVGRRSGAPPVPAPLAWGTDGRWSFLLLEEVRSGRLKSGEAFGRALAALHREGRSGSCGFEGDNWIGSTPQPNGRMDDWRAFFAERRLGFQWRLARKRGYGDAAAERAMDSLLRKLPDLLPDVDDGRPSLIHGDLWGGNWMAGADGRAWLIDPAAYYGHREADLAMTELFGGFPAGFRDGYSEAWPLEPGYPERRDIYNLYHVLNHVNLFGGGYWSGAASTLSRYA